MSDILQVFKTFKETEDSIFITFSVPQSLRKQYQYRPGQFITLEIEVDGKLYRRPYSICSPIGQKDELGILVKRVPGGVVSNYINNVAEVGIAIAIAPPQGNFTAKTSLLKKRHHVFFAAGCGITPIISMIENIMKREKFSRATLFYSSKTWNDTIFGERLKQLHQQFAERLSINMTLTDPAIGRKAQERMNRKRCRQIVQSNFTNYQMDTYYLCGPSGFMEEVTLGLYDLEVPEKNIHIESFDGNIPSSSQKPAELSAPPMETEVEVMIGKSLHTFTVGLKETILDRVLMAELDVNYSCRAGNCSSCKARLVQGRVTSKNTKGLSEKDIKAGYILTCQSQPVTPDVKIEYDI
jgi:ring-1,2-phenylacetyl-CoA epoxidase subunit PaaE